jgi:dynein heavy chain
MNMIEKTIPSLMNGIKLIFVISRHFKSDERIVGLLITISNEICDKIENKFSMKRLFLCPEGFDEI